MEIHPGSEKIEEAEIEEALPMESKFHRCCQEDILYVRLSRIAEPFEP
jgi:hypothetical protein